MPPARGASRAALGQFTCAQLIELSAKAGELFLSGTLPLGDGKAGEPADRDRLSIGFGGTILVSCERLLTSL